MSLKSSFPLSNTKFNVWRITSSTPGWLRWSDAWTRWPFQLWLKANPFQDSLPVILVDSLTRSSAQANLLSPWMTCWVFSTPPTTPCDAITWKASCLNKYWLNSSSSLVPLPSTIWWWDVTFHLGSEVNYQWCFKKKEGRRLMLAWVTFW